MSHVQDWVNTLTVTPDARGAVVEKLRRYRGLPSHFANRAQFAQFLRKRGFGPGVVNYDDPCTLLYCEYLAFRNPSRVQRTLKAAPGGQSKHAKAARDASLLIMKHYGIINGDYLYEQIVKALRSTGA